VFSLAERERRWARVRALMARDGIDVLACLPCTNNHDRGQQDVRYLTQLGENSDEVTVLFPLEGGVTAWLSRGGVWPASNWFTDIRSGSRGSGAKHVIARLQEAGFERGTIGIPGLRGGMLAHVRQPEGEVSWQSVERIKEAFPRATIVSATDLLGEARYVKSEEEIDFLRQGTEVAERTLSAVLEHARAGVVEREVFGWMLQANAAAGGSFPPMIGWISGSLGNTYHRLEQPSFRRLAAGDVLVLEIEGRWAGYTAQVDQLFSIGPAPQDLKDGMKLAIESYDRAFDALRPGVTVAQVVEAAEVRGMNDRGVATLLMHGRGTGDDGPLVTGRPLSPEVLAHEIPENCCLVLKPGASVDGRPEFGRWGETVVVRKGGAERLGTRHPELHALG
jgi:Xaa-Pro aminopeptidase